MTANLPPGAAPAASASEVEKDFDAAAKFMSGEGGRKLKLSDEMRLRLYSHYKQCTMGDCKQPRPGLLDMVGRAKW